MSPLQPRAAPGVTRVSALPAGPPMAEGAWCALGAGCHSTAPRAGFLEGLCSWKEWLVQTPIAITRDRSPTGEFTMNGLSHEKLLIRVNHPLEN